MADGFGFSGMKSVSLQSASLIPGLIPGAALLATVALGLGGLANVGSERWIAAGYGGVDAASHPHSATVLAAQTPEHGQPRLVVGDEQQWLSEPRIPTQKASTTNAGGLSLGDRVVFSVTAKGEVTSAAKTFEIVGIELLQGQNGPAQPHGPHVLIAREVGSSGKAMTLRLLVTESELAPTAAKTL